MSEEKEIYELQRQLTAEEQEFINLVRADKRKCWQENQRLKAQVKELRNGEIPKLQAQLVLCRKALEKLKVLAYDCRDAIEYAEYALGVSSAEGREGGRHLL